MLTSAFQGDVVPRASSSLGGDGVQECRYAQMAHDAAERDVRASAMEDNLVVPYSYPSDQSKICNSLAYLAVFPLALPLVN